MTTINKMPYFMENKEWYEYDFDLGICVLTDKAPPKAVKSYKDFYKLLNESYFAKENEDDPIKPDTPKKPF
jgi:hypothetical protein